LFSTETLSVTQVNSFRALFFARNYQTKDILAYHDLNKSIVNLGPGLEGLYGDNVHTVYTHTSGINGLAISFEGVIYFTSGSEIWSVNMDGSNPHMVQTTVGVATSVAIDPHSSDTLVYCDDVDIVYHNLSTGGTTTVLTGIPCRYGLHVIDGTVLAVGNWQDVGYTRVKLDGTGLVQGPRSWGQGLAIDTVNKTAYIAAIGKMDGVIDGLIPDLPADPSLFSVTPTPISLDLTWTDAPGATSYTVKYTVGEEGASDIVITSRKATTGRRHSIRNLAFSSPYTIYLYFSIDDTDPSILVGSGTHYTTPNAFGNYDRTSFESESGTGFSFSGLNQETMQNLGEVMNELFTTGDEIEIDVSGTQRKTKFVRRGETTNIEEGASIAIPFVPSGGAGQNATLTLSDSTDVVVAFDETTEQITIDGNSYNPGQSLLIDGKKVTIFDI